MFGGAGLGILGAPIGLAAVPPPTDVVGTVTKVVLLSVDHKQVDSVFYPEGADLPGTFRRFGVL